MATFVLVPGAWLGGWAWEPTDRQLRQHGPDDDLADLLHERVARSV